MLTRRMKMMSEKITHKPMSEMDKQAQPLPGEVDPKDVKTRVFLAAQKTKNKFKIRK